ncbi:helix-turn-helix transcriptional regulator [Sphingomonas sp. RB1R13]|uniref:helix-turn-helix transcriptional regulator n=1 Tax=Sphingomonas sp. RB1R13 TaxID=3096159 RepID=UPI002FC90569
MMIHGLSPKQLEATLTNEIPCRAQSNFAINTAGAAHYLSLAESTLEKARVTGSGPRYCKLGRAVRYRLSDLDAWMAARAVSSTSEAA